MATEESIIRIPPYHYIHVLDQNSNVSRVEVGPKTYIRQDNERWVLGPGRGASVHLAGTIIRLLPVPRQGCLLTSLRRQDLESPSKLCSLCVTPRDMLGTLELSPRSLSCSEVGTEAPWVLTLLLTLQQDPVCPLAHGDCPSTPLLHGGQSCVPGPPGRRAVRCHRASAAPPCRPRDPADPGPLPPVPRGGAGKGT